MRPLDIQVIGTDLAIKWGEGAESFISLETIAASLFRALRCKGETDIMGNVYKGPNPKLSPTPFG
jgi:hypothetical protein